jgi:hypothetical protein
MTDVTVGAAAGVRTRWFYVWMGVAIAVIAVAAFAPTYWLQVPAGTFTGSPMLHLHAILFTAWMVFFISQATMVATGRVRDHRAWGLAGISLATAMVFVGVAAAIGTMKNAAAAGLPEVGRVFLIVPVSALLVFGGLFIAAIANTSRPEVHKRLMVVATVALLPAAIARFFFLAATGGGPGLRPGLFTAEAQPPPIAIATVPAVIADLLIVAAIVYDWRTRGRPHPAYLIGGGILLASQTLRIPFSATPVWHAFADFLGSFAP